MTRKTPLAVPVSTLIERLGTVPTTEYVILSRPVPRLKSVRELAEPTAATIEVWRAEPPAIDKGKRGPKCRAVVLSSSP